MSPQFPEETVNRNECILEKIEFLFTPAAMGLESQISVFQPSQDYQ